ncbi:Methyltransferase-like protein 24 [Larimichthys crocea]|uniref:Uncharacterized protein n=1 Tax=Larimichthys crocea TaxID=215358 RepID=A0ACD3RFR6_LARCR|nr:Methyltransferase-like protein 24 [Larimichthys crocea]
MRFVITTFPLGVRRSRRKRGRRRRSGHDEEGCPQMGLSSLPSRKTCFTSHRSGDAPRCRHGGGMRTCVRWWWSRGGLPLRSGILLLLVPPVLLALQLLVVGPRLPLATKVGVGVEEQEGEVAFSVISIEPDRNSRQRGSPSRLKGGGGGGGRWGKKGVVGQRPLEVQPWAADSPSFTAELNRSITYITRPQVHFLYADLLSAEWRVFQNWIETGTLQSIHHLVATVHLQWAGFEVGGTDEEVLRYWFSVLQGLQAFGLKLVHSSAGEGHSVLKQTVANAHSSYTLSWVNTRH